MTELHKILITCENYYPVGGGIQQYIRFLARALKRKKIAVEILTQSYGEEKVLHNPEAIVYYSKLFSGSMADPFGVIDNVDDIAAFIIEGEYQLVYANNHNSLAVILACKKAKVPVVYGCHGVGLLCSLKYRFLKPDDDLCDNERGYLACSLCYLKKGIDRNQLSRLRTKVWPQVAKYNSSENIISSADARIGNSALTASLLRKKRNTYGIPLMIELEGKYGYYKVDSASFKKKYNIDRYIFVPGRLNRIKGHEYMIKALPLIDGDIKVVFGGTSRLFEARRDYLGDYATKLEQIANQSNLKDRVIYTGRLGIEEMRQAYSGALCTVVPSIWLETFGYVTVESMACETPVVVTENCGSSSIIDESCGEIVPRKDEKAIANAIQKILVDPELKGKNARNKISSKYSVELLMRQTFDVFSRVING